MLIGWVDDYESQGTTNERMVLCFGLRCLRRMPIPPLPGTRFVRPSATSLSKTGHTDPKNPRAVNGAEFPIRGRLSRDPFPRAKARQRVEALALAARRIVAKTEPDASQKSPSKDISRPILPPGDQPGEPDVDAGDDRKEGIPARATEAESSALTKRD